MSLIKPTINLIVPAAGLGSRFRVQGFELPKPMIKHQGKSLLEHSVDSILANYNVQQMVFVLNQEHVVSDNIDQFVADLYPHGSQVIVDTLTKGAAETASLGIPLLHDKTLPLVVNDCDHRFRRISNIDCYGKEDWDARIKYFLSTDPRFSFVEIENQLATRIVEKKPISPCAVAGCYVFRNAATFINGYNDLQDKGSKTDEEFISLVMQEIIEKSGIVKADEIFDHQDLGIPEAFLAYES